MIRDKTIEKTRELTVNMLVGSVFSPLDLNPIIALSSQRINGYASNLRVLEARRSDTAVIDIFGYNPSNPVQYKTSAGGSYETINVYPFRRFYFRTLNDQTGIGNHATQTTNDDYQPELIWPPASYGAEQSSGNLTIGKDYEITARDDADFTTDGAPDNNVGTIFRAINNSVVLDTGDKVKEILTWGLPAIKFDGVDDFMNIIGLTHSVSDYTFFVRVRQQDWAEARDDFIDILSGRLIIGIPGVVANTIAYYDGSWKSVAFSDTSLNNLTFVLGFPDQGAIYNGVTPLITGAAYTQKTIDETITIGSTYTGIHNFFSGIVESILIYDTIQSALNIGKLNDYFQ